MKSSKYHLVRLKSFWLAICIPLLLVSIIALLLASFTAILTQDFGLLLLLFVTVLLLAMTIIPALAIVVLNQRNQLADEHNQLLQQQLNFDRHIQHVDHFIAHMSPELMKRLGIPALLLYQLSFPSSRDGDLKLDNGLFSFIHHSFAEIDQAAQVVGQLTTSLDDDEQAVWHNRLEFIINQSVYLMFFIGDRFKGQAPECQDFYFLKDAFADYFDLIMAVAYFDANEAHSYNLQAFNQLFDDKATKAWLNRNDRLLQQAREFAIVDNPLTKDYQQWGR